MKENVPTVGEQRNDEKVSQNPVAQGGRYYCKRDGKAGED